MPPVRHTISFDEADYKIIEGNEDTQANIKEIQHFIDNGYISSVGYQKNSVTHIRTQSSEEKLKAGDIYDIDFISKNFQGTIQNDNLLEGSFYDTWLIKPLKEKNHIMANGYANSWIIDPEELCRGNDKCIRNPDGTYDIDLIIEYWPQRLLYIGLFVSGTTIFFCSLALILSLSKKRGVFSV